MNNNGEVKGVIKEYQPSELDRANKECFNKAVAYPQYSFTLEKTSEVIMLVMTKKPPYFNTH